MTEDVKELQNRVLSQEKEILTKSEEIKRLQEQLNWFKRQAFGRKSEKLPDSNNLDLFGEEPKPAPETEDISYTRKKNIKGHGRNEFPDHLEVKEEIVDIPETDKTCSCCGNQKKCIGQDESKKYEAVPATVYIKKIIRPKYACPKCSEEGITQQNMPKQLIPGGNCGTSLINHVIINKFLNHMPLERQSQDFKRQGVQIAPSTMAGWISKFCEAMEPLYEHMKAEVKSSRWIHTDDTSIPVRLKCKKGKAHKGYLWVYVGEGKIAIFEYTRTRSGIGPREFLKDYEGYMHADAFVGYDSLYADKKIKECACWSHSRRRYFDAFAAGDLRARRVLELCGRLYLIERYMKKHEYDFDKIKDIRNDLGRRITSKIEKWLDENEMEILPKSKLGEAVKYMRNNWDALHTYMEEGYLSIDNNLSERQLRKVVLGRSNWIMCGSETGAQRSAIIYSFICTCKLLDIDPYKYFNDVLEKLLEWPQDKWAELTPLQWKMRLSE